MHNDFITISVGGNEYKVRPNFQAASHIQTITGKPLHRAIVAALDLSVTDLHAILCGALEGNGHKVDSADSGDAIMKDYCTIDTPLIKQILEFANAFFPKVENDGTKKATAMEVIG